MIFFLIIRRPPRSTRTYTLFPYTTLFRSWIPHPSVWGVVAEKDGRIVGSNFLDERDPIRGIGPISVDPESQNRSEEHTSELQSLMRISYAVFCLKKKKTKNNDNKLMTYIHKQNTTQYNTQRDNTT